MLGKRGLCFLCLILMLSHGCGYSVLCEAKEQRGCFEDEANVGEVSLQSPSALLMEASTGQVIFEKNADEQMKPASVTKVMTLLLLFEAIEEGSVSLEDQVIVSAHAASMGGSQCFFEEGESQTVEDMIKCIVIASGNDAAVAVAEHLAGSEEAFVAKMNERAKQLGMKNTNFCNACGLEAEGHVTSARDIAIMSRELTTKHPSIFQYSTIWMDSITHVTKRGSSEFGLANTNKFLKQYLGATGLKTGYTSQAHYAMSATASRNGIDLIAVIMGADTKEIRNKEAAKLLDYGFACCKIYVDLNAGTILEPVPVLHGVEKTITPSIEANEFRMVCTNDMNPDEIQKCVEYKQLDAPVHKGDCLGYIIYKWNDTEVGRMEVLAAYDLERMTYGSCFTSVLHKFFGM